MNKIAVCKHVLDEKKMMITNTLYDQATFILHMDPTHESKQFVNTITKAS